MTDTTNDTQSKASFDFYLSAQHGAGRGSFLVYLSLVGLWASEGESWATPGQTNARQTSLHTLQKFKKMGAKYTGLTVDSIMREAPGFNTLSLPIPVIRLVRDPLSLLATLINQNRLFRFFNDKLFQRSSCTMPSAELECSDIFATHGQKILYESFFQSIKHPSDVRVVDTSETLPNDILATLKRVTCGFELAAYDPQDQRFFKSYGTGANQLLDRINALKLASSQGPPAIVKIWPDYLSYRLVHWRNVLTRRLVRFEVSGQAYHVVQLISKPEEAKFVFLPDKHMPEILQFTQGLLKQLDFITEKFSPHQFSKEAIIKAIRKKPKLYSTFMGYWKKEWSPIEKIAPGHAQKWWKRSLEIVSGPVIKK